MQNVLFWILFQIKKVLGKKNLATCETLNEFISVWKFSLYVISLSDLDTYDLVCKYLTKRLNIH